LSGAAANPGPAAKTIAKINAVQNATFLIAYLLGCCSEDHKFVTIDYQQDFLEEVFLNTNLTLPSPPLDVHNIDYPQAVNANHLTGGSKE
jgi:hypothetical protein